jgi:hypothetical protein
MSEADDRDDRDGTSYAPFVVGSDTSEAAAAGDKSRQRRRVLRALREAGDQGLTDDEGEARLRLSHQAYSARRRGLVIDNLAEDSGRRRKTRHGRSATVWVARAPAPVP